MELISGVETAQFWIGLLTIIWVNVILSGDNAVVIALAARSLPKHQQGKAIFWGAGAAVILRIILTIVAAEALELPFLKILGGLLLFWIATKLLASGDDGDADIQSSRNLIQAIKTILVADLIMSLDNIIAVAAAAKGSMLLLILGLGISIPFVVFGATILMKLMERFPVIITIGEALLGWVAGEMLITDPIVSAWISNNMTWLEMRFPLGLGEVSWTQVAGAIFVVFVGKWLAARAEKVQEKALTA